MKITRELLVELGAEADCTDLERFATEWPDGAEITEETCRRAGEIGLDLWWLARRLFDAPLFEDFEAGRAPLWQDFLAKRAVLLEDYTAEHSRLWADHYAQRALLWKDYTAKYAVLFWDCYRRAGEVDV